MRRAPPVPGVAGSAAFSADCSAALRQAQGPDRMAAPPPAQGPRPPAAGWATSSADPADCAGAGRPPEPGAAAPGSATSWADCSATRSSAGAAREPLSLTRREHDAPSGASCRAFRQVDRPLTRPLGHQPRDLEGLHAGEADTELAVHDEADDAVA